MFSRRARRDNGARDTIQTPRGARLRGDILARVRFAPPAAPLYLKP